MGNLDRNTIILWMITALVAAGGGSLGTQFLEPSSHFYGQEARVIHAAVEQLKINQEKHATKLERLKNAQGILQYRQDECVTGLKENEKELRDMEKFVSRLERLEWDVERLETSLLGRTEKETSVSYPLNSLAPHMLPVESQ